MTSLPPLLSSAPVGSSARDNGAAVHERAGDAHALLLATGELARIMQHPVAESKLLEQVPGV